jgi:hypothetical protein
MSPVFAAAIGINLCGAAAVMVGDLGGVISNTLYR